MKLCPNCKSEVIGRKDKVYCSSYCKSNYHYARSLEQEETLFKKIDTQIKLNRRLLKDFNKSGKATVRTEVIEKEGFNPKFFTHYWKNSKGDVYLFCYEYGFLKIKENNKSKYVLVKWQNYMS